MAHKYACKSIGVSHDDDDGDRQRRKRDREEEQDADRTIVTLDNDVLELVMHFLSQRDLKNVSRSVSRLTDIARRELLKKYTWRMPKYDRGMYEIKRLYPDMPMRDHLADFVALGPDKVWIPNHETHMVVVDRYREFYDNIVEIHFMERIPAMDELVLPRGLRRLWTHGISDAIELSLPPTMRELVFTGAYNTPFDMPPALVALDAPRDYDHPFVFPTTLRSLLMSGRYSFPINLNEGITSVRLYIEHYNHPIVLPSSVVVFEITNAFNQPLILPQGIKRVSLSAHFNQPIVLPEGLEVIGFGDDFMHPLVLPQSLKRIRVGRHYVDAFPLQLPPEAIIVQFYGEL